MNSYLLNARRSFRSEDQGQESDWTFDLSTLTFADAKYISRTGIYAFRKSPDGHLLLLPRSYYRGFSSYSYMLKYDTGLKAYDPEHQWDLSCLDITPDSSSNSSFSNSTYKTYYCFRTMDLATDGSRLVAMLYTTQNNVSGHFMASVKLGLPWDVSYDSAKEDPSLSSHLFADAEIGDADFVKGGKNEITLSPYASPAAYSDSAVSMLVAGDGYHVYILSDASGSEGSIRQYVLDDKNDGSTIRTANVEFSVGMYSTTFGGTSSHYHDMAMSPDGRRLFVLGSSNYANYSLSSNSSGSWIYEFEVKTPYDLTTAKPVQRFNLTNVQTSTLKGANLTAMFIDGHNGGDRLFLHAPHQGMLYQFNMTSEG